MALIECRPLTGIELGLCRFCLGAMALCLLALVAILMAAIAGVHLPFG